MKWLLPLLLTGCAAHPIPPAAEPLNQTLVMDKQVQPMSRNEVITAVKECESNRLRAVMLYGKRKVNGYTADVVLEVTCAPRYEPTF